jgi:hypothetical protein
MFYLFFLYVTISLTASNSGKLVGRKRKRKEKNMRERDRES